MANAKRWKSFAAARDALSIFATQTFSRCRKYFSREAYKNKRGKEWNCAASSWPISRINVRNETRFLLTNETFLRSSYFSFRSFSGSSQTWLQVQQQRLRAKRAQRQKEVFDFTDGAARYERMSNCSCGLPTHFSIFPSLPDEAKLCRRFEISTRWQRPGSRSMWQSNELLKRSFQSPLRWIFARLSRLAFCFVCSDKNVS